MLSDLNNIQDDLNDLLNAAEVYFANYYEDLYVKVADVEYELRKIRRVVEDLDYEPSAEAVGAV